MFWRTIKEDAFKTVFSKAFFDGESVVNTVKIFLDKIDGIYLQKRTDLKNFLLAYPDISGFTTAAVAGTVFTCIGIKAEVKPFHSDNIHGLLLLLPD